MSKNILLPIVLWALAIPALLATLLAQDDKAIPICDHGTSGTTKPLDLESVEQAHENAAKLLRFDLRRHLQDGRPKGATLPACRTADGRTIELTTPVPKKLIGSSIHFLAPGDFSESTRTRNSAVVLVPQGKLSETMRLIHASPVRPDHGVYLASPEMLRTFRIDCVPTRLTFTDSTHAEIETFSR